MVGIQTCCCLIKFVLTLLGLNHPYHFYPESKWIYFHLGYALPMGYLHICLGNFTPDPLGGSGLSYTNGLIVLMFFLVGIVWLLMRCLLLGLFCFEVYFDQRNLKPAHRQLHVRPLGRTIDLCDCSNASTCLQDLQRSGASSSQAQEPADLCC